MRARRLYIIVVLLGLISALLAGAYLSSPQQQLLGTPAPAVAAVQFDQFSRLTAFPGKVEVGCPTQSERTRVLLLLGQSNAANYGGQRFRPHQTARVVQFFKGRCYLASSPLLGASGVGGEPWTLLGDRLIEQGGVDQVVLAPAAIVGSIAEWWGAGGVLHTMVSELLQELTTQYRISAIVWQQGESDLDRGTSEEQYRSHLLSLLRMIRARGVTAPFYVSVSTRCGANPRWSADNPVASAQRALPDPAGGVFAGVNTDQIIGFADRYDDCHFAASGLERVAREWQQLLAH